jgi:hypothetical protein
MGQTPIPRVAPKPGRVEFHMGMARARYVRGDIDAYEFEELAHHVIVDGGTLDKDGKIREAIVPVYLAGDDVVLVGGCGCIVATVPGGGLAALPSAVPGRAAR